MEDRELKKLLKKIDTAKAQLDQNGKIIDELETMILSDYPEYDGYNPYDE